ncbi:UDP-N-acetylmuramate dehydrogenase [Novosphingobium resinovorum]|uniref:UDP-N-acetylenolpyruvoylglucosamine reductase n=1 Tax=Novosphingobium resinovorum TaxID=158500 RepID=A0A1D8A5K1_9SPHN|nr:FAD-binding protein [Novosphingobium resinovorum]AOR77375.1 hypothetical protein BES08_11915 [Novosphingobium resinovorum]
MKDTMATVTEALRSAGIEYCENLDLSTHTYLRTGGRARLVAYPRSTEDVVAIFAMIAHSGLPYKVIGNTSNLLFEDGQDYTFLISIMKMDAVSHDPQSGVFAAQAGVMMPELARQALYASTSGFEGLEGIPGTVAGGLFMNAGAYGYELKDVLTHAELVHPDGSIEQFTTQQLALAHRTSVLRQEKAGSIVTRLFFKGKPGDRDKIFSRMELYHAKRHKYQDFMYPNLGSIFSGSPYRVLGRRDNIYRIRSAIYFLFRYKLKVFHKESPINRRWLNNLAMARFPVLRYEIQPFSDKTLNCLVNRGQGTDAMIKFIRDLEHMAQGEIPLENEIVEPF